ncbi:MAG: hypothetical protein JKY52_00095 [Flavobacteriales bacterium]|nr:hypothetical protein [Flavobacteriales bacterium]
MSKSSVVSELNNHDKMTVEQALEKVGREGMKDVLIISYDKDGALAITSSHMDNSSAVFMLEVSKRKILEGLDL